MSIATQVTELKDAIAAALPTLDKDSAIAAAAYAKALDFLVAPGGVVDLIAEADTQLARVTAEGDTQKTRVSSYLDEVYLTTNTTIPVDDRKTYVVDADITITIPDDRPSTWRVTFLTTSKGKATFAFGNNSLTDLPSGDTAILTARDAVTFRAVSANTFEAY